MPDEEDSTKTSVSARNNGGVAGLKHLIDLKADLALDQFSAKQRRRCDKKRRQKERRLQQRHLAGPAVVVSMATRKAAAQGKAVTPAERIVFQDPRKKAKAAGRSSTVPSVTGPADGDECKGAQVLLDMKQARFEVFKFSLRGMDRKEQHEARVAHAISLGAKPPKQACQPYSEFKAQQKLLREQSRQNVSQHQMMGVKPCSRRPSSAIRKGKTKEDSTKPSTAKAKKTAGPVSKSTARCPLKMGKFDGGMLRLSGKDLARLKK